MTGGDGERLHAQRRKRFWKIVGWLALAGGVGGFFAGFAAGYADARQQPIPDWLLSVATVAIIFSVVIGAHASWRYFAAVDEVEVADNLWSSLLGFYVLGFLYPAWWMLHWIERAPAPHAGIIYAAAMVSALAAYGVRKWRSR